MKYKDLNYKNLTARLKHDKERENHIHEIKWLRSDLAQLKPSTKEWQKTQERIMFLEEQLMFYDYEMYGAEL